MELNEYAGYIVPIATYASQEWLLKRAGVRAQ